MIELLLQAERTLAAGRLDEAERLYRQAAAADPRSSIAVVGLARVALEREDDPEAWRLGRRALAIDPENVAAQRLTQRLEEVYAYRGESIATLAGVVDPEPPEPALPDRRQVPSPQIPASSGPPTIVPDPGRVPTNPHEPRGLLDRLFRRKPR